MRKSTILLLMVMVLTLGACRKDGDFDELRHPLVVEGEFDPVLGLPIAKISANMATLIGMVDSSTEMQVYIDSNDLVSLRYSDTSYSSYNFDSVQSKNSRRHKGVSDVDTIWTKRTISGNVDIDLFNKLHQLSEHSIETVGLYVDLFADIKAYGAQQGLGITGANVYFDNLQLNVECMDGYNPTIPIDDTIGRVPLDELIDGKRINVLHRFDCSYLVERKPQQVHYTIDMNVGIPLGQIGKNRKSNVVDSLSTRFVTHVDFPLQLYCRDFAFTDTIAMNLDVLDSVLDRIEDHATIGDTGSYLVVEAHNGIPLSFALNASLLDENYNDLTGRLLEHDSILYAAPLKRLDGSTSYVSDGYTQSRIVLPLTDEKLRKLRKARYLNYQVVFASSTQGATEEEPTVSVQGKDKLELRAYVVATPHVRLSIPVNKHRN